MATGSHHWIGRKLAQACHAGGGGGGGGGGGAGGEGMSHEDLNSWAVEEVSHANIGITLLSTTLLVLLSTTLN